MKGIQSTKELLSSGERRRLNIIEILLQNDNSMNAKKIAEYIGCSDRIIDQDIQYFDEHLPYIHLERNRGNLVLTIDSERNISEIYASLLSENDIFKLLELIFFNPNLSTNEIINQIKISQATLYRYLGILKTQLQNHYSLSLQTNPYQLTGDERAIRKFYVYFFKEKYPNLEWPFEEIASDDIDFLLEYLTEETNLLYRYVDRRELSIWIVVNYVRMQQGFTIEEIKYNPDFLDAIKPFTNELYFKKLCANFPESMQSSEPEKVLQCLLYPYITHETIFDLQKIFRSNISDEIRTKIVHTFTFIRLFYAEYNIKLNYLNEFAIGIYNSLHICYCNFERSYILYNSSQSVIDYYASRYPQFNQRLDDLMDQYLFYDMTPSQCTRNNVKLFFLNNWTDLDKQLSSKDIVKIVIISDQSYPFIHFQQKYLINELPKFCTLDIWNNFSIDKDVIESSPYDIILSNIPLPYVVDKEFVHIDDIYSPQEILQIFKAIANIKNHRLLIKEAGQ